MHPVRMLVLTPTRELADQVEQNTQNYIKNLPLRHTVLFGGMNMDTQTQALRAGCEIVVATVGRLLDHIKQKNINLSKVEIVVLDEADRMLDMGFIDDIRKIMQMLPKQRQTLLFSATFSPPIRKLAQDFMNQPELIEVAAQNTANANVEQHVIAVDAIRKRNLLERLIIDLDMSQVIVFCKTKQSVDQVNRELNRRNIAAQALHGDKSQQTRLETLSAFKDGNLRVLVATDVAARGLDIASLAAVINVDVTPDPEVHIHRIGRTGRGDAEGLALNLASLDEMGSVGKIEVLQGRESRWFPVAELTPTGSGPLVPPMVTIQIIGGRKEKIRAGDVLGALTGEMGYTREQIGKINVNDFSTYVAVDRAIGAQAAQRLNQGRVKGKTVKARLV